MRGFLSFLLAIIILLAFGAFAVFYANISSGARLERTDQKQQTAGDE